MTSKSCTAEILISVGSTRAASTICKALAPDLHALGDAAVLSRGKKVTIRFSSDDVSTLRASLNSTLLLAEASFRCLTL